MAMPTSLLVPSPTSPLRSAAELMLNPSLRVLSQIFTRTTTTTTTLLAMTDYSSIQRARHAMLYYTSFCLPQKRRQQ